MNVTLRKEEEKDYKKVYEVNCFAFQQENESKLIERIRKGKNFVSELSLVAEIDDEIVGHILFSRIKIFGDSVFDSLALAPMAVSPKFQKKGIGRKLIKKGMEKVKELGFDSIIVLGHKGYYPKFGFQRASKWNIKCPFEVPDEAFMAIELTERAFEGNAGTVKYPDEFMEVE
ncbi:MAG: N-acetyltransferase [Methanocellales archaeon]|nr:N-acetyltransferase [Methanocellales archaeon]MDD3420908.1 N-acetyltransferase [Methanocellales archaeon]MDD4898294.1 N-acetyltransferase [Methanocellales archaeon]MDD5447206.1 N-acetyltransferase [Methanocellales archaeon]